MSVFVFLSTALVREFGADNGEGPKLQSLLLKHAEGKDNWVRVGAFSPGSAVLKLLT